MLKTVLLAAALLLGASTAIARDLQPARIGEVAEIMVTIQTENVSTTGSRSRSSGRNVLMERVLSASSGAVDLEYDLPADVPERFRQSSWQFPARVRKVPGQPPILLNLDELQARSDRWVMEAGLSKEACGQWVFTWTALKIECDPASALGIIAAFDLWLGPVEPGMAWNVRGALRPAPLVLVSTGPQSRILEVRLEVDPDAVRIEEKETEQLVAQMTGKAAPDPVELEARWAVKDISGSITLSFELDAGGAVIRRTEVRETRVVSGDETETSRVTTTATRRPIGPDAG
jgi:hypothetical protein